MCERFLAQGVQTGMEDFDKTIAPQRNTDADNFSDMEKTMAPQRPHATPADLMDMEKTMAPRRERKTDGRFESGDLIMRRYKVLAELGQGGMGVVYKCFDETAGIEVALKALPPELSHNTLEMEDIKDNFQLVHNLHHPNIASSNTLEKNPENGNYYLIMECCNGEDLRRWIRRKRKENGSLTLNDVLPVIRQVADALDYAHGEKIMHRDIKPGNIMIDSMGKVKVLDFGLAAQIHTSMTRVSMAYHGTSGTGPYMAPEQWEGRAQDAKADQYALAVMAYEMLAGRLPFESADPAVLREAVLKSQAATLDNIPKSAQKALDRAMSKEPAERFNSCADFAVALTGGKVANVSKAKSAVTDNGSKIVSAILQRIGIKWIAAGAVVILVALIARLALSESDEERLAREALEREREEEQLDTEHAELLTTLVAETAEKKARRERIAAECKRITDDMVKVFPGKFVRRDGKNVTLTKAYWLGKYEVTQKQYKAIMGENPSEFKFKGDNRPVENVSWHDAEAFCNKLNEMYKDRLPTGYRFDLPTEAQWEFAARGGNKSKGYYTYSGSNDVKEVAWYNGNSGYTTHDVGGKKPNELGLYDMSGNVWEWCRDWSGAYTDDTIDPAGPKTGSTRVLRGSGCLNSADGCCVADRLNIFPGDRGRDLGFRLALVPVQ